MGALNTTPWYERLMGAPTRRSWIHAAVLALMVPLLIGIATAILLPWYISVPICAAVVVWLVYCIGSYTFLLHLTELINRFRQ